MSCGEELAIELRQRGFRVTPQRAVILETIAHTGGHQTAHEVFHKAADLLRGLNIATVYRTLDTLHRAGMVDIFSTGADTIRFSLHDPRNPHYHLVCRGCDHVLELPPDLIERLAEEMSHDYGFDLDTDHLTLSGMCHECLKRENTDP